MASRYPTSDFVDYCFNPIHVVDGEKDILVPCGRCDGCLLHKANEWSMRCGMEIEATPVTLFGTLTYNNKYLPKLFPYKKGNKLFWYSDHSMNVRFDSVKDVGRKDRIVVNYSYSPIPLQNWDNISYPSINYMSKRDVQLWLKIIRKKLNDYGFESVNEKGLFRYFIVSEVGPTTFRNHAHFLLFCQSNEIAQSLLNGLLFSSWKMCSEDRFTPYLHACDSGARGYVTQYLTSSSDLPKVFRENKEIRPFRLASKSPAIGYIEQDKKKIFQDVSRGIITYLRPVYRLEFNSLLEYPKNYLVTLFPKCYRFNKMDDSRRFIIYSFLYRACRSFGRFDTLFLSRFSQIFHASDFMAMRACLRFCREMNSSPDYYYYLLDMYYYQLDMSHFKRFYQSQEKVDFNKDPFLIFLYYPNIEVFCCDGQNHDEALFCCLRPLGLDFHSYLGNKEFFAILKDDFKDRFKDYYNEVDDIKNSMVKMSKYNELTNNSPSLI